MMMIFWLPVFIRELDPGLQEAVSTLLWAAPRLQTEVSELKVVSNTSRCLEVKASLPETQYITRNIIRPFLTILVLWNHFKVSEQLSAKYSKEYAKLCRTNQIGTVNDRVQFVLFELSLRMDEILHLELNSSI